MSTITGYAHLEQRADGRIWLTGTQTKLTEVVLDRLAHHWDSDEIHRQHPHLTLGQIHACLAYYYDHEAEINELIEHDIQTIDSYRKQAGESILQAKLKRNGRAV